MEKINKICIILVVIIVIFSIGVEIGYRMTQNYVNTQEIVVDTTYNKTTLDSIDYNIIKKDSFIYDIKQEMKNEVAESYNMGDSAAFELFKELAGSD